MKKAFYLSLFLLCSVSTTLKAQTDTATDLFENIVDKQDLVSEEKKQKEEEKQNKENTSAFFQELMISPELQAKDKRDNAAEQARKLREQKPQLQKFELPEEIEPVRLRKPRQVEIKQADKENLSAAPFGLMWGGTILDTQNIGIKLEHVAQKDSINVFSAQDLPKPIPGFRSVLAYFGAENELSRIIAYGDFIDDDKNASHVLKQYRKYYALLKKKYGNAKQYYSPKRPPVDPNSRKKPKIIDFDPATDVPSDVTVPDMLKDLQSGAATLYATFEDKDTGAALAVNVDGNNQSYIIIDYKSLRVLRQREEKMLDAL